jgi:DNA-binding MarR family transcriptional regulator
VEKCPDSDFRIGRWIAILHTRAMLFFTERLEPHGVPGIAVPIVGRLLRGPAPSQDELCRFAGRDKATVSRVLERLEEEGYVTRSPDAEDNRVKRVHLTDAGWDLTRVIEEVVRDWNEQLARGLTEAERESARSLLQRMAENCRAGHQCSRETE